VVLMLGKYLLRTWVGLATMALKSRLSAFSASLTNDGIAKRLKRHLKAKRRAYSRALQRIREVVQRVVQGKFGCDFKRVRGGRVGPGRGVLQMSYYR